MIRSLVLAMLMLLTASACVRRDGRNSECVWPGETGAGTLSPDQPGYGWHLSADADFAEELADRYYSRRRWMGEPFAQDRNQCLALMFEEIGKTHNVTPAEVSRHFGRNRTLIDLAVNFPFFLLYGFAASIMAWRIWKRYQPSEGWLVGAVVGLLWFLALSIV